MLNFKSGEIDIYRGKVLKPFLQAITDCNKSTRAVPKRSQVKGQVANIGLVRGRVKLIFSRKDFKKFKDGDVIVAPMTSVDYVPIMERASAYVTDEGGLTCHAAIVSRELNKPCVIGTKIATKVFRDGDRVEVDADNGLVKKI